MCKNVTLRLLRKPREGKMGQGRGKHRKLEVTIRQRKNSSLAQILKRNWEERNT